MLGQGFLSYKIKKLKMVSGIYCPGIFVFTVLILVQYQCEEPGSVVKQLAYDPICKYFG